LSHNRTAASRSSAWKSRTRHGAIASVCHQQPRCAAGDRPQTRPRPQPTPAQLGKSPTRWRSTAPEPPLWRCPWSVGIVVHAAPSRAICVSRFATCASRPSFVIMDLWRKHMIMGRRTHAPDTPGTPVQDPRRAPTPAGQAKEQAKTDLPAGA
jgi:hypothetical protein